MKIVTLNDLKHYLKSFKCIIRMEKVGSETFVRVFKDKVHGNQWTKTRRILKNLGFKYTSLGWCIYYENRKWVRVKEW